MKIYERLPEIVNEVLGHVGTQLDKKAKDIFKIYDVKN